MWFAIAAVDQLDLAAFYAAYRADGHGRAAYEPAVMVAVILYAFATDERSSRGIERHCRQDVAYRVITGNRVPDHATIARFVVRHEAALSDLFSAVLGLCARAGLVASGIVAIDGTKFHANASRDANVSYDQIAREVIADAIATDEAEDEIYGDKRGDELPEELQTEAGRREWLARKLARDEQSNSDEDGSSGSGHEFDQERIVARVQGRHGWLPEAKRQLDQDRWRDSGPVARSRAPRLWEPARRPPHKGKQQRPSPGGGPGHHRLSYERQRRSRSPNGDKREASRACGLMSHDRPRFSSWSCCFGQADDPSRA